MTNLQWFFVQGMLSAIYIMSLSGEWTKIVGGIMGGIVQGIYIWQTQKQLKQSEQENANSASKELKQTNHEER